MCVLFCVDFGDSPLSNLLLVSGQPVGLSDSGVEV